MAPREETRSANASQVIRELRNLGSLTAREGMARFGITTDKAFGVSVPTLRSLARKLGKNHELAQELWSSGYHEARLLASMVDDARKVSSGQMEEWARDFDSWDVVDQCCGNLFDKTPFVVEKAFSWTGRSEEFVKRAGFSLMASLAVHDKRASNQTFLSFLPVIERESSDDRNFVRKAVNWALRQIGKRNMALNKAAITTARRIGEAPSKTAKMGCSRRTQGANK